MTELETHDILSALLDREPVDPDRLAAVLDRPEARMLLVDFVRLRCALHDDGPASVDAAAPSAVPRRSIARQLLAVAAAILLVAAGALVGSRFSAADDDHPPEPSRIVRLQPATDGGAR